MRLDGLGGDERVFGSFGPGAPREVLTALLNGTSYNVMMVGDLPNGAPRELLLTSRAAGGASPRGERTAIRMRSATTETRTTPDDSGKPMTLPMTLRRRCSTPRRPSRLRIHHAHAIADSSRPEAASLRHQRGRFRRMRLQIRAAIPRSRRIGSSTKCLERQTARLRGQSNTGRLRRFRRRGSGNEQSESANPVQEAWNLRLNPLVCVSAE